ncbi:aromatic compound dioxygenase [Stipitochalara longipes BDJ]|nr:aromatic compound dioxygenase [Stipitochalara longipes BDJ]
MHLISTLLIVALAAIALGHDNLEARREFLATSTNNLNHCASVHKASGLEQRAIKRREELADKLLASRNLQRRQVSSVSTSHKSDKTYNASTAPSIVFSGKKSCVLSPETTEGPFYVIGESIRTKLGDGQLGVPLHLDIQVIDVNTCQPLNNTFLEMWTANSTGVYSGALAIPNGSGMGDKANLNNQFLRGVQKTDDDGVVQFETIFPGHYTGRATHVHVITHLDAQANANNTIWNTKVSHIGQAFFDQDLINKIESTAPYNTNQQAMSKNAADAILLQEAATADPFFEYVQLSSDLKDGIFAWFSFGVNTTLYRGIMPVAMNLKDGGQMETGNPKIAGMNQLFPGGFPTSWQPGWGAYPTIQR